MTVIETGKPPVFPPSDKPCPKGTLGFPERDFPAEGTDESRPEPPPQAEPRETESGGGPPP